MALIDGIDDKEVNTRLKIANAKILDYKRDFAKAANLYYQSSCTEGVDCELAL